MKKLILTTIIAFTPVASNASTEVTNLIKQCVPSSHWEIMDKIVTVESNRNLYAIGVNQKGHKSLYPETIHEARGELSKLLRRKVNVDIGLAQINSQHFKKGGVFAKRGFKAEDALDPCTNLKMGAVIFSDNYRRYKSVPEALSAYNTGNPVKGFENGYVAKYIE